MKRGLQVVRAVIPGDGPVSPEWTGDGNGQRTVRFICQREGLRERVTHLECESHLRIGG